MSLQDIFYIVGIITLSLSVILFMVLIGVLLYIKKKVSDTYQIIEKNIIAAKDTIIQPSKIVSVLGQKIAQRLLNKFTKFLK